MVLMVIFYLFLLFYIFHNNISLVVVVYRKAYTRDFFLCCFADVVFCSHINTFSVSYIVIPEARERTSTAQHMHYFLKISISTLNIALTPVYYVFFAVTSFNGSVFTISRVNRLHMGAYLCIASNGRLTVAQ